MSALDAPSRTAAPGRRTGGTRQLAIYAVVVAGLAVSANLYARAAGATADDPGAASAGAQVALYGQALVPALAAVVAWRATGERIHWGFRRASRRVLISAWLLPLLAVAVGYGLAQALGVVDLSAARLADQTGLPAAVAVLVAIGPGVLPWMALAVGEELGWNSFLLPRLVARLRPAVAAVGLGLAWAAFHLPLMLLVPGAVAPGVPTAYAVVVFTLGCVALAFPLTWLRLRTGSIWPALVLHASFNSVLYLLADPAAAPGPHAGWYVGEGGLLLTGAVVGVVVLTRPLWAGRLPLTSGRTTP